MLDLQIDLATASDSEIRRTGIGGADIAAIVNEDTHRTALEVYLSKVEGRELVENERMRRGRDLEPVVRGWYQAETLGEAATLVAPVKRMRHPSHSWWLGQPDGLVYESERVLSLVEQPDGSVAHLLDARSGNVLRGPRPDWLLEIKTHGLHASKNYGEAASDDVPRAYICQVTWYMGLAGVERCDLAALMDTHEFKVFRIYLDRSLLGTLLEAGYDFVHRHLVTRTPPEVDGSDARSRWIRERLGKSSGLVQRATDAQALALVELAKLKAQAKALDKEIERRNQALQEQVGEFAALVDATDKELVTWRTNGVGSVRLNDALDYLAKMKGATDAEVDEAIEATRGKPARPWRVLVKPQ